MNEKSLSLAVQIISKASHERPADTVLRDELRKQRGLSREESREISQLVFSYFRWFGWRNPGVSLSENVKSAWALTDRFIYRPDSFSDDDLLTRAIPPWTKEQVAVSPTWTRTLQREPRLWLRAKKGTEEILISKLGASRLSKNVNLSSALEYQGEEDLFKTPEFHAGDFELQDISSQAVGLICAPKPGETWWDACAGEGGKLLHFSDMMENKGLIWASDRAEWRLKSLKRRTARAKAFNYRAALWDGGEKPPTKTKFDGILVDAPCSGIGTWQRNPHARWTTTLEDVRELAEVQKRLLQNVKSSLKPGGKLIYSVCTLARSETIEVAEAFEKVCPELRPLPMKNPFKPSDSEKSQLWFWPQDCGGNGMFVAAWEK